MTTKKPVYIADLQTRSFSFLAVGRTEPEARAAMRATWDKHREQTGADDWQTYADAVNVIELRPGQGARDYAVISTL